MSPRLTRRALVGATSLALALPLLGAAPASEAASAARAGAAAPAAQPAVSAPGPRVRARATTVALPTPKAVQGKPGGSGVAPGTREGMAVSTVASAVPRNTVVGVTWRATTGDKDVVVALRSRTGSTWSGWERLSVEATPKGAPNPEHRSGTDAITVTGADQVQVSLSVPAGRSVPEPSLTVVDPGTDSADAAPSALATPATGSAGSSPASASGADAGQAAPAAPAPVAAAGAVTPTESALPGSMPTVYSRAAWGADESITSWPAWRMPYTKAVVVHNTAGANEYTAAQVPGQLRGIHYFHAVTRGWGDIGYNVLVDKFGRAWQGRVGGPFAPNLGGHAAPNNEETFGISMMGNYDQAVPPAAAMDAVARVSAYVLSTSGIRADQNVSILDGSGIPHTYPAVVTHQAVAAYGKYPTGCPGTYMIARMGTLRSKVLALQSDVLPGIAKVAGVKNVTRSHAISASTYLPWEDVKWTDPGDAVQGTPALVIVPSTDMYPQNGLLGANLALAHRSPVMVVEYNTVTSYQVAEIARLRPRRLIIAGDRVQIPDGVMAALAAECKKNYACPVERVGGATPTDTAVNASRALPGASRIVYLADTRSPQYWAGLPALSKRTTSPILLTDGASLPAATLTRLRAIAPTQIRLAAGSHMYPDSFLAQLRTMFPGVTVNRAAYTTTVDGQNAYYATESLASKSPAHSYYVRIDNLAMAAPALSAAGRNGGVVFFTTATCTPPYQQSRSAGMASPVRHAMSAYSYASGAPFLRRC